MTTPPVGLSAHLGNAKLFGEGLLRALTVRRVLLSIPVGSSRSGIPGRSASSLVADRN